VCDLFLFEVSPNPLAYVCVLAVDIQSLTSHARTQGGHLCMCVWAVRMCVTCFSLRLALIHLRMCVLAVDIYSSSSYARTQGATCVYVCVGGTCVCDLFLFEVSSNPLVYVCVLAVDIYSSSSYARTQGATCVCVCVCVCWRYVCV